MSPSGAGCPLVVPQWCRMSPSGAGCPLVVEQPLAETNHLLLEGLTPGIPPGLVRPPLGVEITLVVTLREECAREL